MLTQVFSIVFVHLFADICLQNDRYAALKGKVLRYLVIHCYLYAGAVSVFLFLIGRYSLWKAVVLFASHFLIDKYLHDDRDIGKLGLVGYLDQVGHLIILIGVFCL